MKVWLLRHGETIYNKEGRYQGWLDIPLSEEGKNELFACKKKPALVYVSDLCRTAQTAEILFPGVLQKKVPKIREMNFGRFEGQRFADLRSDPDYVAWLESGGRTDMPEGETKDVFSARVIDGVTDIVRQALEEGEEWVVIVMHGGCIMAAMEEMGTPKGDYYEWLPGNGEGFELSAEKSKEGIRYQVERRLSFQRNAGLTHLYYGDGRGKTSAAMGTALRALSAGQEVYVVQLCKKEGSGESRMLTKLGAHVFYGKDTDGFVSGLDDEAKKMLYHKQTALVKEVMERIRKDGSKPALLILDEACAALRYGVIDPQTVFDAVVRKPTKLEVILTGRKPPKWLITACDYVCEYSCIRHPLAAGIPARQGVEF